MNDTRTDALQVDALWPLILPIPLLAVIHWGVVRRGAGVLAPSHEGN